MFFKISVLINSANFLRIHMCQSLFFNKVLLFLLFFKLKHYLKKRLWHRCFLVNFAKFLRTPFFTEHSHWLLLRFRHFSFWEISGALYKLLQNQFQFLLFQLSKVHIQSCWDTALKLITGLSQTTDFLAFYAKAILLNKIF